MDRILAEPQVVPAAQVRRATRRRFAVLVLAAAIALAVLLAMTRLLGADGLLAGGPVAGGPASLEFIEEVTEQLRGATEPAPAGEPAEAGRSERP